ncbi:DUF434 domain-containing protein [Nannocystaceae bacterium ST9]
MPRGPAQDDERLFGHDRLGALRLAVWELSWLLGRGYAEDSALKLVGDRHGLLARQRTAALRCACTDAAVEHRRNRRLRGEALAGRALAIDGFNQLIAVEVALSGGVILIGRDGVLRDMAGIHGSYKRSERTLEAATAIGERLEAMATGPVVWWLDRPVSNSGRLRAMLLELSEQRGWGWQVELDLDPDRVLIASDAVVASGDAWILDEARVHFDLARETIATCCPQAWRVDLEVLDDPASTR